MNQQYAYPLDYSWTTKEKITVISFFNSVEAAYETGIVAEEVIRRYALFKQIVPSKSQEKQLGRELERESGYSLYQVVKMAQLKQKGRIFLGK